VRVGSADDVVTLDTSVGDLTGNVTVAQADNQPVLGGVVLVLVLEDEALASIVVSSALATTTEPDLVPLEVLLVLNNFYEALKLVKKGIR
jgi:hypothetical protein